MFVILLMTIIVGGLVVTSSVQLGKAQNSYVNFSGTISSDTTWSVGNTYNLTGSTIVAKGATLTIEPGVSVIFIILYIQTEQNTEAIYKLRAQ